MYIFKVHIFLIERTPNGVVKETPVPRPFHVSRHRVETEVATDRLTICDWVEIDVPIVLRIEEFSCLKSELLKRVIDGAKSSVPFVAAINLLNELINYPEPTGMPVRMLRGGW